MKRKQIIKMAREVGVFLTPVAERDIVELERFYALAYAAGQRDMRERAAAACGALADNAENSEQYRMGANWSRERIRALPIEGENT